MTKVLGLLFSCTVIAASCASDKTNDATKVEQTTTTTTTTTPPAETPANPAPEAAVAPQQETTSTEQFIAADGKEEVTVRYFSEGDKMLVGITQAGGAEQVLEQVPGTAFAKGADYEKDGVKWQANGDKATFISGGKTTKFSVKK